MSRILAICGKKTSGKTTLCNFLHGYQLKAYGIIEDFDLTDKGKLIIKATNDEGLKVSSLIDVANKDLEFGQWAAYNMWPFVKQYSFATTLKDMAINLFEIPHECIYGTNERKEQLIEHLRWENMPGVYTDNNMYNLSIEANPDLEKVLMYQHAGPMTARQFMQFIGTEIFRRMYGDVWANLTLREIVEEKSQLAVIDDGRFDNEIDRVHAAGGKAILLRRVDSIDDHFSEHGFINTVFDGEIDAREMSVLQMCEALMGILNEWGWLSTEGDE